MHEQIRELELQRLHAGGVTHDAPPRREAARPGAHGEEVAAALGPIEERARRDLVRHGGLRTAGALAQRHFRGAEIERELERALWEPDGEPVHGACLAVSPWYGERRHIRARPLRESARDPDHSFAQLRLPAPFR